MPVQRQLAVALSFLLATAAAFGQCGVQESAHLFPSDGTFGDFFGYSVAIEGDTAIVGARDHIFAATPYSGAAYVFVRSGGVWSEQAILTSDADPNSVSFADFGNSVAISGDTAAVGSYHEAFDGAEEAGAVYVFVRSGTTWTPQARLTEPVASADHEFGASVALQGNTLLVGARGAGLPAYGAVYVFTRSLGVWTQTALLQPSPGTPGGLFGTSVALSGDTALVGASVHSHEGGTAAGAAYVFTRSAGVWNPFGVRLIAADPQDFAEFGTSVALSADTALIGALNEGPDIGTFTGAAYVFVRSAGVWSQQQKLTASDASSFDTFGSSVAVSGNTALVGAYLDDNAAGEDAGSAYLFARSGAVWTQQPRLSASDAAASDYFGYGVAFDGETMVVTALNDEGIGSAYVLTPGGLAGDLDADGSVDLSDLAMLLSDFGCIAGPGNCPGDVDGDGDTDLPDLALLLAHFGESCP